MPFEIVILRLFLSAVMAAAIGIEREIHRRSAGLRTHILVGLGATLFMMTSITVALSYGAEAGADPSRIAAGVVTGIGFLGAGAIIRYGSSIKGLTTAASIWVVAAIGLAIGAGMYWAAFLTTALSVTVLVLSRLEERMESRKKNKSKGSSDSEEEILF